ncbi:hypothetical protein AXE80_13970 [Wenyingzhuangia fucanilytica]|uniref:MobA-like NTP transferase domain-containing protein n=1 Tax=Wenyingzhuangia fucanilytica TaxID=1790137 RepID=A0A1B1Y977_9FLAO|nr:nucleotidyltransferase family protein [Wenyingzhuangia fucanilytica]ANW97333.1 hypothetical protein AXE80_13970 [Wenyingzhuangia fucanilytica]
MISSTAFLILAAGGSARMQEPKQLLPFKNEMLLTHTIKQVLGVSKQHVFVVLGANYKSISKTIQGFSIEVLQHLKWEKGIGSSIAFGVSQIQKKNKYQRIVIVLSDQPEVCSKDLEQVLENHIINKNKITVTACYNYTGVPAVFDKDFFEELKKLSDDTGAKSIIKRNQCQVSHFKIDKEILDIDTSDDYDKMLKKLTTLE